MSVHIAKEKTSWKILIKFASNTGYYKNKERILFEKIKHQLIPVILKTPNESVIIFVFKTLGCVKYNFFVRTDINEFGTKFSFWHY